MSHFRPLLCKSLFSVAFLWKQNVECGYKMWNAVAKCGMRLQNVECGSKMWNAVTYYLLYLE